MPPRHSFIPTTITTKILQSRMMSHFSLWRRLGLVPDSSSIRQRSILPTTRDTCAIPLGMCVYKLSKHDRKINILSRSSSLEDTSWYQFKAGAERIRLFSTSVSNPVQGISLGNSLANHSSLLFPGHEIASSIAMRRHGA